MFHFEVDFSNFIQEPLCIYDLRDRLLTLQKIGCTPRILNALHIKFDRDLTLVDLMEEFPCIEGMFLSSEVDGWQLRGMRKLAQMKDLVLAFDGRMENNQLRLSRGIRNIHFLPICITDAENISEFLEESLPRTSEEGISLTLDAMQLVYNWGRLRIPKSITRIGCTQRRNLPAELLRVFKNAGFRRGERTEDMVFYERGDGAAVDEEYPEEKLISEDYERELILKIIKEAFCG